MNPRHTPFLRLFLPWASGIAAGAGWGLVVPGLGWGLAAGLLLLLSMARWKYDYRFRWVFGAGLMLMLFAAGYWHATQYDERQQRHHFSRVCPSPAMFTGVVSDAPSRGARLKVPLRLETAAGAGDSLRPCSGNVLLFLPADSEAAGIRYGDRLWVQADIRPSEPPKNPHAFDYRQYLHFQNIHFQAFVPEKSYEVIATGLGHPLWRVALRWRDQLLEILQEHFPGRDEYAVAAALLVGYKDDLSEELRTTYAETGSMHALAVSGTHVGLLYAGLLFLLRRIPWRGLHRRWGETGLSLFGIWAFALVTGATGSVLRASVMFSFYLIGKAIHRQASIWNILAASAFFLLLYNPYFLFDAGFQLSYSAVAGLAFFYPMLQTIALPLPKWVREGWQILLIGVAAQLGTLPLSLYYFHQFPVYFWLAGWVVVLGGAVFLWGGSVLVFLHHVAPDIAAGLGWLLYQIIWGMNQLMRGIQQLPGSVISGIWITTWTAVLLAVFIWLLAAALRQRQPRWLLTALALLVVLGVARAGQSLRHQQQRMLTLYHANRDLLIDCFDGYHCHTWTTIAGQRQERFAAQINRWAHGIRQVDYAVAPTRAPNVYLDPPFLRFYDKTLVVVDRPGLVGRTDLPPVQADILLLHGNPRVTIPDCLRQFPCKQIVFSAGNSPRRVDQWKRACRAAGLPCHDVRERGFWNLELRQ